jgi:vacuolar protein sorting-associated protein 35
VVFSNLTQLEGYFHRTTSGAKSPRELYEMVQHAGNVLPRLYLMITAGTVYIRSRRAPAISVLKDMCEMCRGVQNPTRALFLRYYLLQKTTRLLPEEGSPFEGEGGDVADAMHFLLENTVEMIRLWVRMQSAVDGKSKKRRVKERREIRQVVSTAIDRLANLEGLNIEMYAGEILPHLAREMQKSDDGLAQEFLFDCILQGFPVAFHLEALPTLLKAASSVVEDVSVKELLSALLRRLASDPEAVRASNAATPLFHPLLDATCETIRARGAKIGGAAISDIFAALCSFCATCFPGELHLVDLLLGRCAEIVLEGREADEAAQAGISRLLTSTWAHRASTGSSSASASSAAMGSASFRTAGMAMASGLPAKQVALMRGFPSLMEKLSFSNRRAVGNSLAQAMIDQRAQVVSVEECESILNVLSPLLRDETGSPEADDPALFEEEQVRVAKLLRCLGRGASTLADEFAVLCTARTAFGHGSSRRIVHTLPPLVFRLLELLTSLKAVPADAEGVPKVKVLLRTAHETCAALSSADSFAALKLFLECGNAAKDTRFSFEFLSQALLLHEDVPGSAEERASLLSAAGTLRNVTPYGMGTEQYETLAARIAKFSAKLLRKTHGVECVLVCARLFWLEPTLPTWAAAIEGAEPYRKAEEVRKCLNKALDLANEAIPRDPRCFVDLLSSYVYFLEQRCPTITPEMIPHAIKVARERISEASGEAKSEAETQLAAIVDHAKKAKASTDPSLAMWAPVSL